MNVKLVFLPAMNSKNTFEKLHVPPLAIYVLASILQAEGHMATVIDPCEFQGFELVDNLIQKCTKYIENQLEGVDVLAFSSNTFNWGITKEIINNLKNDNHIPIILGGLHPSVFDEYALKTTKASFILRGEGEMSFVELLNKMKEERYEGIDGLTYKKNGEIIRLNNQQEIPKEKLMAFPNPAYLLLPLKNEYTQVPVESSRGCAFSCTFCSIPHRNNWRGFSVDEVVKRVEFAIENTNGKMLNDNILFVDDCFSIDASRAVSILEILNKRYNGEKKFFLEARISNILKRDFLEKIPRNIIYGIQIGVECGYDEGLKKIRKGLTIKQLYDGLKIIYENGYDDICFLSFIIGFPWETEEEIKLTLDTVENIAAKYNILCNINWLMLLPSDLWDNRHNYGIDVDESIFDDPLWIISESYFRKVHPNITDKIFEYVDKRMQMMKERTLNVSYNRINIKNKRETYMNRL